MDLILYLSVGETLNFLRVRNFRAHKNGYGYDVEFDYYGESTQKERHLVMTNVIGYSQTIANEHNYLIKEAHQQAHQETLRSAT